MPRIITYCELQFMHDRQIPLQTRNKAICDALLACYFPVDCYGFPQVFIWMHRMSLQQVVFAKRHIWAYILFLLLCILGRHTNSLFPAISPYELQEARCLQTVFVIRSDHAQRSICWSYKMLLRVRSRLCLFSDPEKQSPCIWCSTIWYA